ncbi:MAG TPA: hypothetical protein VKR43_22725 [Bryobacteraceae bacterium]|nr:hypothetical protein [Bryobacteraceae bacterium]
MHLGSLSASNVVMFLVILGLSFTVARLDFVRRRGKQRLPVRRKPGAIQKTASAAPVEALPVEAPKASVAAPEVKAVAELPLKRTDRMLGLPGTNRAVSPKLAFGDAVPLPMPAPKLPTQAAWRRPTVTWWPQES